MRSLEIEEDPTVIFNRIYALGYGEGDNQLNIKKVNNGLPYVEDKESIAKYGLRQYIWADKRFEDAKTLKASAEGLLKDWKVPKVTIRGSAADISKITGRAIHELTEGKVTRLIHPDLGVIEQRIVKEMKSDFKGNPGDIQLEIANKTEDLGTTTMDLERRQQINELYSQGAVNIDTHDHTDNADPEHPVTIRFYTPEELVKINKLLMFYETTKFRAYERATKGGGRVVSSTKSGGATVTSTKSGGQSTQTSSSGGQASISSEFDSPTFFIYSSTPLPLKSATLENHYHAVEVESDRLKHRHTVNLPAHTHSVNVPGHTHEVEIKDHSHEIEIPDHVHEIDFGIYELEEMPSKVTIKVDGNTLPITDLSREDVDLIPYLSKDSEGRVNRGTWHTIEVFPDKKGRVSVNVIGQYFIQSRGGTDV